MKNKYTFSKYVKQQGLPINITLIGLLLSGIAVCILVTYLSISILIKLEYIIYAIIFSLIIFFILYIAYKDYQDCKREYYINKRSNNYEK